ncbi:MAG: hypothetical protein QJT81_08465 [Candidatus Thiothrix putei]|uniref:Uncharacterized protein n=1 Tax=Candidatus Thiothrix putei TaxID=3080811 RepID=A0AA95HIU5_9GAMM|nr:MAG: hypothetical protein QJT81_08465 [Candidatus Thiothrix putei]
MAFGASTAIWGKKLLPEVRRNLATIATTIARYEPVSLSLRIPSCPCWGWRKSSGYRASRAKTSPTDTPTFTPVSPSRG